MRRSWGNRIGAFVLALLVATLGGSLVQSQFNLAAIAALGVDIPVSAWVATSARDLVGFAPLYAGMLALVLALALPTASWLARRTACLAAWPHGLAAAVGLWVALSVADALAPMPTLIAATREWPGTLAMLASAGLGGWVYWRLRHRGATP